MLTRVFSALFATAILLIVMILPAIFFDVILSIIALMAMRELYSAFKNQSYKPLEWLGYISIIIAFTLSYMNIRINIILFLFLLFVILLVMYTFIVLSKNKVSFVDVSVTMFSMFYITFFFSFLSMTRHLEKGNFIVWFIFFGGWVTDIFAYFVGKFFGRKKLIPDVSPNKTIAGAIGGMAGCIFITVTYGLLVSHYQQINLTLYEYILLGILCSIFAQFGDLMASAIKRTTNVKDFGHIMPGHGGIIDRFDSILFVSPIVYFFFYYIGKFS